MSSIMKKNYLMKAAFGTVLVSFFLACSPKYGCPSSGQNFGAERHLSGEKVPKTKKFKA
jgi:hypothetical protein